MSFRAIGLAAAIAQLILLTANLVLATIYGNGFLDGFIGGISILIFPAVGLAILNRHPRHMVGLLFCLSQLGWAINNVAGTYARAGLPNAWIAVWLYVWPGVVSGALTVLLLLRFPDGRFLNARWRRFGQAVLASAVVVAVASAVAPGPIDPSIGIEVSNPLGLGGFGGDVAAAISALGYPLQVPEFVVAAIGMVLRYRRAALIEREQLKWFATSVGFAAVMIAVELAVMGAYPNPASAPLWTQILGQFAIFSVSLIPVAAAIAILRYRLYDIDVLIRRTVIYGATTAGLAVTFFAVVLLVETVLSPFTRGNELAVAASTLVSLTLFQPFRRRIQEVVDRRFYRSRYDAARVLDAFSARLRDEVDLDTVRADLIDAADRTVQPAHASVWLRERRV